MLKNEKEKFFLSIIVVLIVVGFLTWQGIININADISNNINELKDKKVSSNVYALKEKSLKQEQEAYDFSKNKIEKINNYFVYASDNDDTEFTTFFRQLDDIAIQSTQKEKSLVIDLYQNVLGVARDKTNSGDPDKTSAEKVTNEDSRLFKLTLKSNFAGLLKFISYLEAMPYYVYIESVNINADGGSGASRAFNKDIPTDKTVDLQSTLIIKVFRKTNIL